jgi:hypothetical protein
MPFTGRSFAASLTALLAVLVLFAGNGVQATALTYKIDANEKACFYAWVDKVGEKIAFYFAVSSLHEQELSSCWKGDEEFWG